MRELSWLAVLLGVVIGALLGAANAFVGLKVGMTVSASIPAAVLSLLILRTLLKQGTLLESNIVQTVGSAGESVASGMIFTIPALFIMGAEPVYLEILIWSGIGGMLGVCFMVPLRHVLIVKEHGTLPYPEGVACAEVLESGERGGSGARAVIWGSVVGGVYYLLNQLGCWKETGKVAITPFRTEAQLDSSPALLGVGYILGARIAGYMLSGALLAWFVLIPAIAHFGAGVANPIYPESVKLIAEMTPTDLWSSYIRYIGAGAVAVGGLISLFKSMPTILSSFWHLLRGVLGGTARSRNRTEKDFPFTLLILIIAGLGYAMWSLDAVKLDHIGVIAVIVFTFFFVTVSSRLVGLIGASSNPISGMTIATLLGTALLYKLFVVDQAGEMSDEEWRTLRVVCLSVGAIVCVAIGVAGDTSQDLKTGFLLKATPYKQQIGEMLGVLTSVVVLAGVLLLLDHAYGFVETPEKPHPLPAYQANIMKILVEGVLGGEVPWTLLMMGGAGAVIVEMLGLPALPFAVGMYLPLGLSTPIMVGGCIRWLIDRKKREKTEHDPGTLTAAGLVAGKGLMGVALAGVTALIAWWWSDPRWLNPFAEGKPTNEPVSTTHLAPWIWEKLGGAADAEGTTVANWGLSAAWWDALPMCPFFLLVLWLWWCARKRPPVTLPPPATAPSAPPGPIPPLGPPKPIPPSRPPISPDSYDPLGPSVGGQPAPKFRAGTESHEGSVQDGRTHSPDVTEHAPAVTPSGDASESPTDQTDRATDATEQYQEQNPDDDLDPPGSPVEPRH